MKKLVLISALFIFGQSNIFGQTYKISRVDSCEYRNLLIGKWLLDSTTSKCSDEKFSNDSDVYKGYESFTFKKDSGIQIITTTYEGHKNDSVITSHFRYWLSNKDDSLGFKYHDDESFVFVPNQQIKCGQWLVIMDNRDSLLMDEYKIEKITDQELILSTNYLEGLHPVQECEDMNYYHKVTK